MPHVHDFGDAAMVAPRTVGFCTVEFCSECRVAWRRKWREPTASEQLSIVARMWEDVIYVDALSMIHGRQRAVERVRRMRGYS